MTDPYANYPDDLHPAKNFTPRQNPPKAEAGTAQPGIDAQTIALLDQMPASELRKLIRRVSGAMWGVGLMDPKAIADAFKLKLAIGGMTEKDMFKALPIMREWFDRELGKAPQSVAMTIEDKGLGKLSDERLLRLERELARMTGQDAVVIAPEPKKLADNTISSDD